jgi:proteasome lid subunit RPN8/RPN11
MIDALYFDLRAFLMLLAYVRSVETEICGIGRLQRDQFDICHITDIRILPQIVGGADANVTAEDMEKFFEDITEDERPEWCFNWHTHPTFSTNPSSIDLKNYTNLNDLFEVLVPFIFNQKGEYNGYVYHSHPVRQNMAVNRIWIYEWRKHYKKLGYEFDSANQVKFIEAMFAMQDIKLSEEDKMFVLDDVELKVKTRPAVQSTYTPPAGGQTRWGGHFPGSRDLPDVGYGSHRGSSIVQHEGGSYDQNEIDDQDFIAGGTDTRGLYHTNPHNWPLKNIIEEMADYDFDFHKTMRSFFGRVDNKNVEFSIREAKDFLCSVMSMSNISDSEVFSDDDDFQLQVALQLGGQQGNT